ncbi:MAG: DUF1449 family protein [Polyangiaceae bacterium]|nr:DUF1449 family protein [Polyangiaceae bacterium]
MEIVRFLLEWANVPFVGAIAVAFVFALLQVTGLLGLVAGGDHDGDADGGDADGDADADADGDADTDADQPAGFGADLGVGKLPISIVWQTYAATFGLSGVATNAAFAGAFGHLSATALLISVPIAGLAGYFVTRALSRVLSRVVANPRHDATSRAELIGHAGITSTRVTTEYGEVRLLDKSGHPLRLVCRTRDGAPIAEGREVVFVEYDRQQDRLYVEAIDD